MPPFLKYLFCPIFLLMIFSCFKSPNKKFYRYVPGPIDNPLKGFFPYAINVPGSNQYPHSLEWFYLKLNTFMAGPNTFDFAPLERQLNTIASRSHQAVMRVVVDMPSEPSGLPQFLLDSGLKTFRYEDYGGGLCPDYRDENLIRAFEQFISAFGARYDGDPRIGFITVGLLGFWGEWHTYPHEDWFPPVSIQNRILHAYHRAFNKTKLLMRYPMADGPTLKFGYHDDSFAHSTLPRREWHFLSLLKSKNELDAWENQVIGGELRPEVQPYLINGTPPPQDIEFENFKTCVIKTHCTWLLNDHLFSAPLQQKELERAQAASRLLGYDYMMRFSSIKMTDQSLQVDLQIENKGVAPFYYDWDMVLECRDVTSGDLLKTFKTPWQLAGILPKDKRKFHISLKKHELPSAPFHLHLFIPNPLKQGHPLRLANRETLKNGAFPLGQINP